MKKVATTLLGLSLTFAGAAYADGSSDLHLKITNTANGAVAIGAHGGAGTLSGPPLSLTAAAAHDGAAYAGSVRVDHACDCSAHIEIVNTANNALAIGNARAGSVFVNVGGFNGAQR